MKFTDNGSKESFYRTVLASAWGTKFTGLSVTFTILLHQKLISRNRKEAYSAGSCQFYKRSFFHDKGCSGISLIHTREDYKFQQKVRRRENRKNLRRTPTHTKAKIYHLHRIGQHFIFSIMWYRRFSPDAAKFCISTFLRKVNFAKRAGVPLKGMSNSFAHCLAVLNRPVHYRISSQLSVLSSFFCS